MLAYDDEEGVSAWQILLGVIAAGMIIAAFVLAVILWAETEGGSTAKAIPRKIDIASEFGDLTVNVTGYCGAEGFDLPLKVLHRGNNAKIQIPPFTCDGTVNNVSNGIAPLIAVLPEKFRPVYTNTSAFGAANNQSTPGSVCSFQTDVAVGVASMFKIVVVNDTVYLSMGLGLDELPITANDPYGPGYMGCTLDYATHHHASGAAQLTAASSALLMVSLAATSALLQ